MNRKTIWIAAAATAALVAAGGATAVAATSPTPTPTAATAASTPLTTAPTRTSAPSGTPGAADDLARATEAALAAAGPGTVIRAHADDDATHAWEIDIRLDAGGTAEVTLDSAFAVVSNTPGDHDGDDHGDDGHSGATGTGGAAGPGSADADRAAAAALAAVGQGTVTKVAAHNEHGAAWEVDVEIGDEDVEVDLDAQFQVLSLD